jgi:hypothetical protein
MQKIQKVTGLEERMVAMRECGIICFAGVARVVFE